MKKYFEILFVAFLLSIFTSGCVKKEKPVVETNDFTDITSTSAKCSGNVISDGDADVSNRGICWSKDEDPSTDNDYISVGNGLGSFTCVLENLDPGTTYYYKAFATNSEGTSYGAELFFKTLGEVPTAINNAATEITHSSARLSAGINPNHLATTVTFEYGTSTNYGSSAAAPESPVSGNTNVTISANLSSLLPGTIYHYRVKAVNSLGTTFSEDLTFRTLGGTPAVSTVLTSELTISTVNVSSTVNANFVSTTVTVEYGTTEAFGSAVTVSQSPVTGNTDTPVTATISTLTPGTLYYIRIKSENSLGVTYSDKISITTLGGVPTTNNTEVTSITASSVHLSTTINPNYLQTSVSFEYGTSTAYGQSVQGSESPLNGNSNVTASANLSSLLPGTVYHYRVKAVNSIGTVYSNDLTFTTLGGLPIIKTPSSSDLTTSTATVSATVNANHVLTTVTLEYGTTSTYGTSAVVTGSPVNGNTDEVISANLSSLLPGTVYHFRIKAENSLGSAYSGDLTFKTIGDKPAVTLPSISNLTTSSVKVSTIVNANHVPATVVFEYGTTDAYGSTVSAVGSPVSGSTNTSVNATISSLNPGTLYFIRVKAENSVGITYSNDLTFTTLVVPVITSLSTASVKYGNTLKIFGTNLNATMSVVIGNSSQSVTITPKSKTSELIEIEIYNQQNPNQLLGFSSFKVGLVYPSGTTWSDDINIISSWTRLPDFPGSPRYKAGSFALDGKIYIGAGASSSGIYSDFWCFDPNTGIWTSKANIPGSGRVLPKGFSNSTNGFFGSGYSSENSSKVQFYDFHKYSPSTNSWERIPDYPDEISNFYVGFAVNVDGRPFLGLSNTQLKSRELVNDTWQSINAVTEATKGNQIGAFSIGKSYYLVIGYWFDNSISNQVWEYNTETSQWNRKADFPGLPRNSGISFSIGAYGYFGCGRTVDPINQYSDIWRFDPAANSWVRIDNFPGGERSHLVSCSTDNSGYAGLGFLNSSYSYFKDFWRFDP